MRRHEPFLLASLDSAPQTNEVRRSAVLIEAGHWLTARCGLPLMQSDMGASAGLNLVGSASAALGRHPLWPA